MAMIARSIFQTLILAGAALLGSSNIKAQTLGLEYATEWQTDFSGGYDWLNLLRTSAEVNMPANLSFRMGTISTAKTGADALIADRLTYSNIEAPNIPLTFSCLGVTWEKGCATLFAGINNVNEDYFTSELTSFFTNSSCGISPTISCNYDIANYPLAAWCVHYSQRLGRFGFQTSLYPGRGYSRILGHDNVFTLNIKRDGIFSISSIDYKQNGIYCVMGIAIHRGVCIGEEVGEPTAASEETTKKEFSAAPWLLSEIDLPHNLGLHLHASYSSVSRGCKGYGGLGLIYNGSHVQPGAALNYAKFSSGSEWATEITCRVPLHSDKIVLQPALHLVSTDSSRLHCVGLLRFTAQIQWSR